MADVRTTNDLHHPRNHARRRSGLALVLFLIAIPLLAVFVASVMNMQGAVSWPAGRIEFGLKSPLPQAPAQQAPSPASTQQASQ